MPDDTLPCSSINHFGVCCGILFHLFQIDNRSNGRILILDAAKGGVASAWMLYEMAARKIVPAALVLNAVNPIMVQGTALAGMTLLSGFDQDITLAIANGAEVEIDADGDKPFIRVI
ncbi:MAG: DUF126 domain-containing protein [Xanthobacteraceae bacterium]|nr:DUF126 domain-containing protein [Xanthobacteraceae bacterium]